MSDKLQQYDNEQPEGVKDRPWVTPTVDVFENDQELLLLADLPGVEKDDLHINLDKDQLTIEGQVKEEELGTVLGREYRAVDYRRTFIVPAGIDGTKIQAELNNGVLRLSMPKSDDIRPRNITVTAG